MTFIKLGNVSGSVAVCPGGGTRTDAMLDAFTALAYLSPYLLVLAALLAQPAAVIPTDDD
jgi:hypothetical protein